MIFIKINRTDGGTSLMSTNVSDDQIPAEIAKWAAVSELEAASYEVIDESDLPQ